MKTAIVIGATSGIGKELALVLSHKGYTVCATGRRTERLDTLKSELSNPFLIRKMDVSKPSEAIKIFQSIVSELVRVDLVVISAGTGFLDSRFRWENDKQTIDVNVIGFTAIANAAYHQFREQQSGHLVGISSIAALRGGGDAPAYNASKAFISTYLQGIRQKVAKLNIPIVVTDVRPGFVDTDMAKGKGLFWVQSPQKAAMQIYIAIKKKKSMAYITKRWRLIAWLLKILPDAVYHRM
jgi:short-subunit dehydrogenase